MNNYIGRYNTKLSTAIIIYAILELSAILLTLYFGILNMIFTFVSTIFAGIIGSYIGLIIYILRTDKNKTKKRKSISILGVMGSLSGILGYSCGRMLIKAVSYNDFYTFLSLAGVTVLLSFFL